MPITINGSGTVTGISAGGLPDNSITNAELADDAVNTAEIADNAVGLAEMAGLARGKLIYGDSSGNPAALAVGSANQVLTADGTDFAWAAAAGGGKIVKFWHTGTGSGEGIGGTTASTTYAKKGYIDITPTSASNKILIVAKYNMHFRNHQNNESNSYFLTKLVRTSAWDDTTSATDGEVIQGGVWIGNSINGAEYQLGMATHFWLDSPATTSNRRYAFYAKVTDTDWTLYLNYNTTNQNILAFEIADVVNAPPN